MQEIARGGPLKSFHEALSMKVRPCTCGPQPALTLHGTCRPAPPPRPALLPAPMQLAISTLKKVNSTEVILAALYDLLFSQEDRHADNILIDDDSHLALIDDDKALRIYGGTADSIFLPTTPLYEYQLWGRDWVRSRGLRRAKVPPPAAIPPSPSMIRRRSPSPIDCMSRVALPFCHAATLPCGRNATASITAAIYIKFAPEHFVPMPQPHPGEYTLMLDYRCHVEGLPGFSPGSRRLGTKYPAPVRQCLAKLASMTDVQVMEDYGARPPYHLSAQRA